MVEFIVELILDLIVDGGLELTKNRKVSKWIRYPIVIVAFLVTVAIFGLVILISFKLMREEPLGGLLIFGLTVFFLGLTIYKTIKVYKEVKEEHKAEEDENLIAEYKDQKGISPELK